MALNKQIKCADGTLLSVQASETHRSESFNGRWVSFEVKTIRHDEWFEIELSDYEFDNGDVLYNYVPRWRVEKFIAEHGGILYGKIPESPDKI